MVASSSDSFRLSAKTSSREGRLATSSTCFMPRSKVSRALLAELKIPRSPRVTASLESSLPTTLPICSSPRESARRSAAFFMTSSRIMALLDLSPSPR